ncbi:MAG: DoxX family protein [Flavobacteriaceae bacterium]|nr:DoxX family protein [Flavobacteriaceae bacterium]
MGIFNQQPATIFVLVFLIITFVISSVEKITDWSGTVSFIKKHFEVSPLKNSVPILLLILLVLEIIASTLMILGIYQISVLDRYDMALLGVEISSVSLIFMLIGQRLAKDYNGAVNISIYFIISILGLALLQ